MITDPLYVVYTPYPSAVVHRAKPRITTAGGFYADAEDQAYCGFEAKLGWFSIGSSAAQIGAARQHLCQRCVRKL